MAMDRILRVTERVAVEDVYGCLLITDLEPPRPYLVPGTVMLEYRDIDSLIAALTALRLAARARRRAV